MKRMLWVLLLSVHTLWANEAVVVGLHGILSDSRSMRFLAKAACAEGFDYSMWNYDSCDKTIQEHAQDLVCFLQKLVLYCPGKPIHLVAHSFSALIIRAAINLPGFPQEALIGRIVLIAPPNKGSRIARKFRNFWPVQLALGNKSGYQLMTYDGCQIVQCFGCFPQNIPILVVAGTQGTCLLECPNDGYIAVDETSLEVPYYFKCYPLSHGRLIKARSVLKFVCTFLKSGPCCF